MTRTHSLLTRILPAAALIACAATLAGAQDAAAPSAKKTLGVADYTRWRTIESAGISGDGRWVVSVMRLTNLPANETKPEVHLRNLDSGAEVAIAHASSPMFSSDSKWLVYEIDSIPARAAGRGGRGGTAPDAAPGAGAQGAAGRGGAGGPPQPLRRYELRELASGTTRAWKDISSATFNNSATHLILRRRAA
ncbi:MAG: hypothetical protein ACHQSE_12095, partial [Gemmatimonadales bacterium]